MYGEGLPELVGYGLRLTSNKQKLQYKDGEMKKIIIGVVLAIVLVSLFAAPALAKEATEEEAPMAG